MTTTQQLVEVTPLAAEKLATILKEQGDEGSMLRVMVMPGSHGGFQYSMGVEKEPQADDLVIEVSNIQVLVDPESAPLVEGAQIDYVDGLMRSGFTISNPNQQVGGGGCACGGGGGGCGGGGGAHGGDGGGGCACGGHGH
ncbi:MAG: iron-sulfur cluster assembly accessory protein [Chloroflexi bacterium]|nr:iron-sulfur cluster assembly accessory protein [Chloroflexota bacterium]